MLENAYQRMNSCVVIIFRDLGGFLAEWFNEPAGLTLLLIASAMTWKEEKINFIRRKGKGSHLSHYRSHHFSYFCSFRFSAKKWNKAKCDFSQKGRRRWQPRTWRTPGGWRRSQWIVMKMIVCEPSVTKIGPTERQASQGPGALGRHTRRQPSLSCIEEKCFLCSILGTPFMRKYLRTKSGARYTKSKSSGKAFQINVFPLNLLWEQVKGINLSNIPRELSRWLEGRELGSQLMSLSWYIVIHLYDSFNCGLQAHI